MIAALLLLALASGVSALGYWATDPLRRHALSRPRLQAPPPEELDE